MQSLPSKKFKELQQAGGNWVLIPNRPKAIVHFLGGAFLATTPRVTYRWLLENLANAGYAVIATPFINTFEHLAIAQSVLNSFENCVEGLQANKSLKRYLPVYGLGHSMGCKLHLLIGSIFAVERAGNILISFNNFSAREAVPGLGQMPPLVNVEFTPSPEETNRLITESYQIRRNLLIQFSSDTIDGSLPLRALLDRRFPKMVTLLKLNGNHLTPIGQELNWPVGPVFTPIDAVGQWIKQSVDRDLNQLKREILRWLNPLAPVNN
jgi:hypothetical protein